MLAMIFSLLPDLTRAWGPGSPTARFWVNGSVRLIEVSHSDIFFTGRDILLDGAEIAKALDIMKNNSDFKWQHECMLFLRTFIELYPEREQELVQRLRADGLCGVLLDTVARIGGEERGGEDSDEADEPVELHRARGGGGGGSGGGGSSRGLRCMSIW